MARSRNCLTIIIKLMRQQDKTAINNMIDKNIKKEQLFGTILLVIAMSFCFVSCEKEQGNSLVGTKWVYSRSQTSCIVTEFVTDNTMRAYSAYTNTLAPSDEIANGTYSISGNNITFSMPGVWAGMLKYEFKKGILSGNLMTITVVATGGLDLSWDFVKQ